MRADALSISTAGKRAMLALMTRSARVPYWRPLVRDVLIIFMLHRFADAERGIEGTSIESLRRNLQFLRRQRFRLVPLGDLFAEDGSPMQASAPSVAFTVDDGYADFVHMAAPVFAEYECPVTVFLATGPVDHASWFWWDRVEYAVKSAARRDVRLVIGDREASWPLASQSQRRAAAVQITEELKRIPNEDRLATLGALSTALDVEIPSRPPAAYSAMSWGDVRALAAHGVTFGPHTVTHPMLPQVTEADAEWEIVESWRRIRAECENGIPMFCYPNGAFSPREIAILARTDLTGAVTTSPHYAVPRLSQEQPAEARFSVPRFNYSDDRTEFVSMATGLDRISALLRQGWQGWRRQPC